MGFDTDQLAPRAQSTDDVRRKPERVSIIQRAGAAANTLLTEVLLASDFWQDIAQKKRAWKRSLGPFKVIIKPDLDCYEAHPFSGTQPDLVEHLIDQLHDRGYVHVAVGEARHSDDSWLENRAPMQVPDLVGYRFTTLLKKAYEVFDIRAAPGLSVAMPELSTHWVGAGYRVNFAKNKTHEDCHFALCLHNLAGLAAAAGGASQHRRNPEEDCLFVMRTAPPHFNLIDGFVSAHGGAGHRAPRALATHTFIASTNILLADWAGSARMGIDPYASPVSALALKAVGLPLDYKIEGELTPYPLWRNVHPLLAHSARLRNGSEHFGGLSAAWLQTVDRERFAFRDFYNDRINAYLAPLLARVDDNPRSFWLAVLANIFLSRIDGLVQAQNTLFSKDKLKRRTAPLLIDPMAFQDEAYDGIEQQIAPYRQLLRDLPVSRHGVRWRHVNGAIIFSCSHVFAIDYGAFVKRVEISRAIQYMNDYVGGSTVTVQSDRAGRIVRQAERNLYLQQPNWMVLFGAEVIDVEKLQSIAYQKDRQTIHWRTVSSPNASALIDDGSVSFSRTTEGQTRVEVFAHQHFALPLALQVFDINLAPSIRDPIIDGAYAQFFEGTMSNLQAAYDGREFRIGRETESAMDSRRQNLPHVLATAAAAIAELLRHRRPTVDIVGLRDGLAGFSGSTSSLTEEELHRPSADAHGFRHFSSRPTTEHAVKHSQSGDDKLIAGLAALVRDAPAFARGLADAIHSDLNSLANLGENDT
jgi:uncharacterized protein (DUF362 family)